MDDLLNREYNGWENKFTWQVHLHLSNEQTLFLEIAQLVANEPNNGPAGRLIEMWVRLSITNWMNRFPGRNRSHDAYFGLLVWDLLGSALASTEWNDLVTVLTGGEVISNVFTMTLTRCIQQSQLLQTHVELVLRDASSAYSAAEALKAWFEALLADWVDKMAVGRCIMILQIGLLGAYVALATQGDGEKHALLLAILGIAGLSISYIGALIATRSLYLMRYWEKATANAESAIEQNSYQKAYGGINSPNQLRERPRPEDFFVYRVSSDNLATALPWIFAVVWPVLLLLVVHTWQLLTISMWVLFGVNFLLIMGYFCLLRLMKWSRFSTFLQRFKTTLSSPMPREPSPGRP